MKKASPTGSEEGYTHGCVKIFVIEKVNPKGAPCWLVGRAGDS